MNVSFANTALEDLFKTGTTSDRHYSRLPKDIVKRYIKVVNYLRAATHIEDLFQVKSLHYEKKKGDLKGIEAVWLNTQYRLLFTSSPNETGIIINIELIDISKHYE